MVSRLGYLFLIALASCGVRIESGGGSAQPGTGGAPPEPTEPVVDAGPITYPTHGLRIMAAGDDTCVVSGDGHVACWGAADTGQLGLGDFVEQRTPAWIPGLSGVVDLAIADGTMCAAKSDGTVWCWGSSFYGELGPEAKKCFQLGYPCSPVPVQVAVTGAARVAGNYHHICALLPAEQAIECWGDGSSWSWKAAGYRALAVTTGNSHACVRFDPEPGQDPTRNVVCVGGNAAGELGTGASANGPIAVGVTGGFVELASGMDFTCGVDAANELWCWGANVFGTLGVGCTDDLNFPDSCPDYGGACAKQPMLVSGLPPVAHVAAHFAQACATTTAGEVYCWGVPSHQSPGGAEACFSTNSNCSPTPKLVPGVTGATSIAVGWGHACVTTAADEIHCWGLDTHGQLGRGDGPSFEVNPVKVELPPETF